MEDILPERAGSAMQMPISVQCNFFSVIRVNANAMQIPNRFHILQMVSFPHLVLHLFFLFSAFERFHTSFYNLF
jgi:hypothetical protein